MSEIGVCHLVRPNHENRELRVFGKFDNELFGLQHETLTSVFIKLPSKTHLVAFLAVRSSFCQLG